MRRNPALPVQPVIYTDEEMRLFYLEQINIVSKVTVAIDEAVKARFGERWTNETDFNFVAQITKECKVSGSESKKTLEITTLNNLRMEIDVCIRRLITELDKPLRFNVSNNTLKTRTALRMWLTALTTLNEQYLRLLKNAKNGELTPINSNEITETLRLNTNENVIAFAKKILSQIAKNIEKFEDYDKGASKALVSFVEKVVHYQSISEFLEEFKKIIVTEPLASNTTAGYGLLDPLSSELINFIDDYTALEIRILSRLQDKVETAIFEQEEKVRSTLAQQMKTEAVEVQKAAAAALLAKVEAERKQAEAVKAQELAKAEEAAKVQLEVTRTAQLSMLMPLFVNAELIKDDVTRRWFQNNMAECFNAESATKRFENLETCVKNWIEGYALSSKKFSLLDSNKKLSNILNLLSFQIKEGVIDVMAIMRLALSEENLRKLSLMDSFKNALTQLQSKYSKGGERCKFQQTLNNLCAKATDPEVSLQEVLNEIKTSLGKNASAILAADPLHAALTLLLKQVEEGVINQERILASIPVSAASSTGMFSATSSTPSVGNLEPAETSQLTVSLQSTLFVMCSSLSDFFINLDIMFNHSENRDLSNTLAGIAGNLRLYVGEFDLESRIKKMKWMAEAVVQVRGECLCQPTRDAKEPRARLLATMIELSAQIHQGILDFDKLNDIAQHGAEKYNKPQNNKRWNPFGK